MTFDLQTNIIYLDNEILVLNKPSGISVIPDGYDMNKPNLKQLLEIEFSNIYVVHRLDKDTSGLILFALDKNTHRELNLQFENRKINKKYISISQNIPQWIRFSFKEHIKVNGDRHHRTVINPEGKFSHTDFWLVKKIKSKNISVIMSSLHTGYTHQIRCHLSYLGFPILGDPLYKNFQDKNQAINKSLINRTALHAYKLSFLHPAKNERLQFFSPLPADMENIIDKL